MVVPKMFLKMCSNEFFLKQVLKPAPFVAAAITNRVPVAFHA